MQVRSMVRYGKSGTFARLRVRTESKGCMSPIFGRNHRYCVVSIRKGSIGTVKDTFKERFD